MAGVSIVRSIAFFDTEIGIDSQSHHILIQFKNNSEVILMSIYLQTLDTPEEKSKFETLYYNHRRTPCRF